MLFLVTWVCLYFFDWRFTLYVPGVICILTSLFLFNRLRDTPQSLGLPAIEKFRNDYAGATKREIDQEQELTTREILFEYVLKNKWMWLLAIAYFFVYVVRTGMSDWTALYMHEEKGYSFAKASVFIFLFEAGGFFGNLAAGWSSDYLFKAKRAPVMVLFSLGMLMAILAFCWVPGGSAVVDASLVFMIGFFLFGPQMMIGMSAAELSHKKAAATATGFVGIIAYFGAASAGYPLGKIAQELGWEGYFWTLSICGTIALVALLPLLAR